MTQKYEVIFYPEVGVKISGIEANSYREAVEKAEDFFRAHDVLDREFVRGKEGASAGPFVESHFYADNGLGEVTVIPINDDGGKGSGQIDLHGDWTIDDLPAAPRCDKPGCNCAAWRPEGCAWDGVEPDPA